MVSIHRSLGYGPSTLPLRHSATVSIGLVVNIQIDFGLTFFLLESFPTFRTKWFFSLFVQISDLSLITR